MKVAPSVDLDKINFSLIISNIKSIPTLFLAEQ